MIAPAFSGDEWFHPRPSAAGQAAVGATETGSVDLADRAATSSAASNLGRDNPDLAAAVAERAVAYRETNGLAADEPVPLDAVTASGSGLDPHISPENARLQAARVADARGLDVDAVLELVEENTDEPTIGVLGEEAVNIVRLNLAVAELAGDPTGRQ